MKKRILSFLLVLVMLAGMLPVTAMAADGHTITTGDTYKPSSWTKANVISQCVITGATITSSTVSQDCLTWEVYMPADTDTSAKLSYTISIVNTYMPTLVSRVQASFNGAAYVKTKRDTTKIYTATFSGIPDWKDGEATVTFAVAANGTATNARTYTLNLHIDDGVNNAPVLTGEKSAAKTLRVNDTYELDLSGIFEDQDSLGLSYSVSINEAAPVIATASFQYVPETAGTHTLVFTASDGELTSEAYTVTLTVINNVAPVLAGDAALAATAIQDQAWTLDLNKVFTDEEGDALTHTVAIDGAEPVAADVSYSYTPTEVRDYTLDFQATDIKGDVSPFYTVTLTVTANPGPVLVGGSELSADAMHGLPWTLDLTKVFTDNEGDPITYTVSVNGAAAVSANGSYSYTPAAAGTDTLVFQAADGKGAASPTYTVTLNVAQNPAPALAGDAEATFSVTQYSPWTMDISGIFADNDDDSLTYTVAIGSAAPVSAAASYSYTPTAVGTQSLVFRAVDLAGNQSEAYTVTLNVSEPDMSGGVWINHTSANGSLNYVTFTDTEGQKIEGLEACIEGTAITVMLPKSFDSSGSVKAAFNLTQNANQEPFVSTKTAASGPSSGKAVNNKFNEKNIVLSSGSAVFTFYYFNAAPSAVNDQGLTTYTITFKIKNEAPVLAENVSTPVEANVAASETYALNLSPLFTDAEGDSLTYQYKADDGNWTDCGAAFTYSNDVSGKYVLTFRAYDSKDYSTDAYVVNLTVKDSSDTYAVKVTVPAGVAPTFYASDETGILGAEIKASASGEVYTVNVPSNLSYIAWRADDMGMHTAVTPNAELALLRVDFKVMAEAEEDTAAVAAVTYGDLTALGSGNSFLLVSGAEYAYTVTPDRSAYRTVTQESWTPEHGEKEIALVRKHFTVTVPAGSVVSAGALNGSYKYSWAAPLSTETAEGITTYRFAPLSGNAFIRVQRPNDSDAVTYWDYRSSKADGQTITVTEDKLHLNDDSFNANTVYRSFEQYGFDLGDVYMNINAKGYMDLAKGSTKQLYMFRNWQVVESINNAKIALPDFHYEIINIDGSDVITIEPDANNSAVATLTAKNEGTAIVLVTYDAMFSELVLTNAMGGSGGPARFSAIWPDRTGVFVVSVGKDGSAIQTNMTLHGTTAFDAEHTPLFYTGSEGASFSFKPEDGCKVTVNRSTVGAETLSFGSFVSDGVTVAADGTVTVSGLTTGRHIIRVEKNGLYTYQVVTATQVTVAVTDVYGKAVTAANPVNPGETVTISFKGLTNPAEKMATAYNFSPIVRYVGADGTAYTSSSDGSIGSYNFSAGTHKITVTVPGDWSQSAFVVGDGCITLGGLGGTSLGGHRNYDYHTARGSAQGMAVSAKLAQLPVVSIPVDVENTIPVTSVTVAPANAEVEEDKTVALLAEVLPADATVQTVTWTSSDSAVATVNENGVVTGVKAGSVTVTAEAGGKKAQCAVTVTAKPVVNVTGVSLNANKAELKVGKTLTLNATVTPSNATDKTVTWTSSKESVATVSGGIVTAVAEGTATITATAGSFSATCEVTVAEEQETDNIATVYFSVSDDAGFLKTDKGYVIAMQELDVPYFDLALYGLEEYKITEEKPTMLHLYLYATEVFLCGVEEVEAGKGYLYQKDLLGTDLLAVSGSAGSIFMEKFWNMSLNLNYYHNYVYPADSTGYGTTADRVVLSDGDIVTIGHFTSWSFFNDSTSIFNYIVADGKTVVASATQEQTLTLNIYRAGADMGGGSNTPVKAKREIYYAKADALTSGDVTDWELLGTTDENGQLKTDISGLAPGQYILATAGQYGAEYPLEIVSTPGGIILNVLESEVGQQVQAVIGLIGKIGDVDKITLDSEAAIRAARTAYDNLNSETLQLAVTNRQDLFDAVEKLAQLKEDKAAADAFTAKVEAIGPVEASSQCKALIDAAEAAYTSLSDGQKALVAEAYAALTKAKADYIRAMKAAASAADKAAVQAVEDKIAAIADAGDKEAAVEEASKAYSALDESLKSLVENADLLENAVNSLAAQKVDALIDAIGKVTPDSGAAIQAAREAYKKLTDAQKALVENERVLSAAEETLELLKLGSADLVNIYQTTGDYLAGLSAPTVGTTNGEWRVLGLARADRSVSASYYAAVEKHVKSVFEAEGKAQNGRLDENMSSENSRLIVALTAMGKDVTDVAGVNLLSGLNDMAYIGNQGINGTIWALIAFDSHDYEIPAGDVTREKLIDVILGKQLPDGGWALGGTSSDSDVTGMALQALAPYYGKNAKVTAAIDEALNWISDAQKADGSFSTGGVATPESTAQIVTALAALGIDPEKDSRFVKNSVSAVDALAAYYVEGGGFARTPGGDRNIMSTEQGYYALVAYYRLLQGKASLYDMSDVTIVIPVYKITEGANSQWQRDGDALTIKADGEFAKFTGVKLDDRLVDSKHYTAKAGSTVITLAADYLKTLAEGEHTVAVLFTDGEAVTSLTVLPTDEEAAARVEALIDAIGTVTKASADAVEAARAAYDKLTGDQKKLVDNYKVLTQAETALDGLRESITVSFTLLGDSIHGETDAPHTLSGGGLTVWIPKTDYTLKAPATVLDVFRLALAGKYSFDLDGGNYISAINSLAEFTNGANSGWMYTLNGSHPNLSVAEQTVKDGDVIVFHYTDDYTKEDSSQGLGGRDTAAEEMATAPKALEAVEEIYEATGSYLEKLGTPGVGSTGGEWMVIGLARSGRSIKDVDAYYETVVQYVQENVDGDGRLHQVKSTENSRLILALTAIGKDVTNVGGYDLLKGLGSMDYIQKQGINGPIWALLAFDSGSYPVPEGDVSRQALIQVILDAQLSDGGWALTGTVSDPDITGMALQALAPYYQTAVGVEQAVDEAIAALSEMQAADGSFASIDGTSSESISQVIVALAALGIDAHKDARFVKNGVSPLDALCAFYVEGGGFRHVPEGKLDGIATEQGYYALTAYFRMLDGKTALYDMTDVIDMGDNGVEEKPAETAPAPTEPAPAVEDAKDFPWWLVIVILVLAGAIVVLVIVSKPKKASEVR